MPKSVTPFIKWVGGKRQLLETISNKYPDKVSKYCEPFVGGGCVMFDVINKLHPDEIMINDINSELINTYTQIKTNVDEMIESLIEFENLYNNSDDKQGLYLNKRSEFNMFKFGSDYSPPYRASIFIFLNKTCFNGLYRVNSSGSFNVPFGKHIKISFNTDNILNVNKALQNVNITCGDYRNCSKFIDKDTFVYIDPPYRPLNSTSAFNSYDNSGFNDNDQIQLSEFIHRISDIGAKFLLSNSDPTNTNPDDLFFDNIYYNYNIERVNARRLINSVSSGRGYIRELLISNY